MNDIKPEPAGLFTAERVTDDKRLVRGEHLLLARTKLRARDFIHNAKWRVMMLCGRAAHEEINAIRDLMPSAIITAADIDDRSVEAARAAGADLAVKCDIRPEIVKTSRRCGYTGRKISRHEKVLASCLTEGGKFDLIDLDFCGNPTEAMRDTVRAWVWQLNSKGCLMVTFSYGRDVVEAFLGEVMEAENSPERDNHLRGLLRHTASGNLPRSVLGRILFLLTDAQCSWINSIMLYRGSAMPMCSLLMQKDRCPPDWPSFVKVGPGDFELAVLHPDPSALYACPQERIERLRRHHAAIKARITAREKEGLYS